MIETNIQNSSRLFKNNERMNDEPTFKVRGLWLSLANQFMIKEPIASEILILIVGKGNPLIVYPLKRQLLFSKKKSFALKIPNHATR